MLGYWLLSLAIAAGLAVLLAWCCKPKKLDDPEDHDLPDQDPPYKLRSRPTVPALDLSIYHRY